MEKAGYHGDFVTPCSVCDLMFENLKNGNFSHYRRKIDMEKAEVSVSWQDGKTSFLRSVFASRENHLVFTRFAASNGTIDVKMALTLHDPETMAKGMEIPNVLQTVKGNTIYFATETVRIWMEEVKSVLMTLSYVI